MPCHCLTKKGKPCKNPTKPGERFCWIHKKNCDQEIAIVQVPRVPEKIAVPKALAKTAATKIVKRIENGETPTIATAKTLDELVNAMGVEDITDLHTLTEEELDYFISTIMLHENAIRLADIVEEKIAEQNIRDPHALKVLKSREVLDALAGKFCRCIKKVMDRGDSNMTEGIAIAICRKGVIQNRGLTIPRFACKTYPDPTDKTKYEDTPIFLPSKTREKILEKHPGYLLYLSEVVDGDLESFSKLKKAKKDDYLQRAKK